MSKGFIEAFTKYETPLNTKTCLLAPLVAGIGKEIYDSQHDGHNAEFMDFAATVALPVVSYTIFEW